MIKKLFILLCLCCIGIGSAWGADKTYSFTPDTTTTGSSATAYVTNAYSFTYNEIGWSFNQWNPSTLQIKTNQSSAGNEFNFKNTSAFPGRIKSVVITFKALTVSNANGLCFVGGSSAISSLSGGSAGTWNSSAKTLTWTPADGTNYTYFAFYQNGKVASGTNNLAGKDAIVITYEEATPTTAYTVTFNAGTNGTCTEASLTEASAGAGVTLPSCTANEGYVFKGWSTTENGATPDAGKGGATYKPSKDCTLYAVYAKAYVLTITQPADGGTLTVTDGTNALATGAKVEAGTKLTCEVTDIPEGKCFNQFNAKYEGGSRYRAANPATFDNIPNNISALEIDVAYGDLPQYTINYMVNGVNTNPQENVYEGKALVFPTVGEFGGKVFVGWSETEVAETDVKPTLVEIAGLTASENATYYAVFATLTKGDGVTTTDVLNRSFTGVTDGSTSYTNWTKTASNSGATYAGNSAGSNNSIQLRWNLDEVAKRAGIVTTVSGGLAKKVTIEWNTNTPNGRTLNVYGSNTAFTSWEDVKTIASDPIGTIVMGTSTTLNIDGDYKYIALRSAESAIYISSMSIEWVQGSPDTYSAYSTTVTPLAKDVTIASSGYSSFSSTYAVTIPEGITAYYATGVSENKVSMVAIEDGKIPANTGAVIKGEAGKSYTFVETNSADAIEGNCLVAVSERIEGLDPEVTIGEVIYKNYVFTQGQFHPFTTDATVNVGAGKAYLQVVKPADPNAKLEMNFDGGTTGIDAIRSIQVNDNAIYNLRGERVNTMLKGNIYIVNGKKYLVK